MNGRFDIETFIYNNAGEPVGFWIAEFVFSMDGHPIGQIVNDHVYSMAGTYVGEFYEGMVVNRLRRNIGGIGANGDPGPITPPALRASASLATLATRMYSSTCFGVADQVGYCARNVNDIRTTSLC
jgi:4-fold beta flower protein